MTLDFINSSIYPWLVIHGVKILLILVLAWLVNKFIRVFINRLVVKALESHQFSSDDSRKKRKDTLAGVFSGVVKVIIWIVAGMMMLSEVGVNIGPLLAGAGVAGLAFGFGAQYLIRDVISGMFLILENQYRVGDVVSVDGVSGLVEEITLRKTVLRDLDGTVHHIPNGEIKKASNLSKTFSRVNLNVGVSYSSDLDRVIEVVNEVGNKLAEEEEWKSFIIKPPQFLRVDKFADSAIEIKILGETKPLKQWEVMGELRKRIKVAFDKNGIEIPFPQRVVHQSKK